MPSDSSPYKFLDDLDLATRLSAGDEMAFTEIFNRYWKEMYTHALTVLEDDFTAQDIVQDVFVKIWHGRNELAVDKNLAGYLYAMTRNKVLNHLRACKHRSTFQDALEKRLVESTSADPDLLIAKDTAAAIEAGLQVMPGKMKEIFELSRNENLTHKEIASSLQITVHTVKKQINRALKIIRFRLS